MRWHVSRAGRRCPTILPAQNCFRTSQRRCANPEIQGEINDVLVASTADGAIRGTLAFVVISDGTAGGVTVIESENPSSIL